MGWVCAGRQGFAFRKEFQQYQISSTGVGRVWDMKVFKDELLNKKLENNIIQNNETKLKLFFYKIK